MEDHFLAAFEHVIGVEREFSDDPADSGGKTRFGITEAVARENGYSGAMRDMSRDDAIRLYRAKYWAKPGLYLIAPLSAKVAEELLDTGVNMGTGTAGIFFQRALNALNRQGKDYADVKVDGAIGPGSAAAFKALLARRGALGETVTLIALNCLQGARYIELAEGREANEEFELGWLANRVELAS